LPLHAIHNGLVNVEQDHTISRGDSSANLWSKRPQDDACRTERLRNLTRGGRHAGRLAGRATATCDGPVTGLCGSRRPTSSR
jgi:hypothetical protein